MNLRHVRNRALYLQIVSPVDLLFDLSDSHSHFEDIGI
jgi:hypothetical protein